MAVIEEQPAAPPRPGSLWRNRDYGLLWGGQIVSAVGSQVSQLALPLLILAVTHSPAQAGLLAAVRGLPYLLLVLPAGALVDRWDPRRVMLICDTGRAMALASVPVALAWGHLALAQLYAVSLVEGALYVFFDQAESNCLVRVVPKDQLPEAVARNQAIYGTSNLAGPALGGLLYSLGRGLPFLADAISYALSVAAVLAIKSDVRPPARAEETAPNLSAEIREGLRWLRGHPVLPFLALLTGGLTLCSAGYALILIVLAQKFHAGPAAVGLLLATGGIGIFLGSLVGVRLQKTLSLRPADDRGNVGLGGNMGFVRPRAQLNSAGRGQRLEHRCRAGLYGNAVCVASGADSRCLAGARQQRLSPHRLRRNAAGSGVDRLSAASAWPGSDHLDYLRATACVESGGDLPFCLAAGGKHRRLP